MPSLLGLCFASVVRLGGFIFHNSQTNEFVKETGSNSSLETATILPFAWFIMISQLPQRTWKSLDVHHDLAIAATDVEKS
jgi:hypothetical protein